jgi:uncharacterized SAM-binding protein YcdF (DUF218 family)
MLIYCVVVTLPIRQILYIAQETLFLWMLMAILFACALFFLASLILLYSRARSAVYGIHTRVAKLIGSSSGHPSTSKGPMLHLSSRR